MSAPERLTTSGEVLALVEQVRADAARRGAVGASQTHRTADGEITVDYRAGDWLRITFTGDASERTHILLPTWPD